MSRAFLSLALLPLALALAAEPPAQSKFVKRIEQNDIPLEDLAHSFLFHSSDVSESLKTIISEDGISRLRPELFEHSRDMNDIGRIAG